MWLTLLNAALAAGEPCYGHLFSQRLEGEHYWVEWEPGDLPDDGAQIILDTAEHARSVYLDMGYLITDEPVVITARPFGDSGIAGLTSTRECEQGPVPSVALTIGNWSDRIAEEVTAHEIAHVVQYAYMGSYVDSVASWLWWMEGHATWMTPHATGGWKPYAATAQDYLERIDIALHHDVRGFGDPDASAHMYGTAFVVDAFAAWEGDDGVRSSWSWGGARSGERLFLPTLFAENGVDFEAFWADYLARLPTLDVATPKFLNRPPTISRPNGMPAEGDSPGPETMGVEIVSIPADLGEAKRALDVQFEGDPLAAWRVVLAVTDAEGKLVEYSALQVDGGAARGRVSGFDGYDAWLVVSPGAELEGRAAWSWAAELVKDDDPQPGAVVLIERDLGGCAVGGLPARWGLGVLGALAVWRRRGGARARGAAVG